MMGNEFPSRLQVVWKGFQLNLGDEQRLKGDDQFNGGWQRIRDWRLKKMKIAQGKCALILIVEQVSNNED